MALQPPVLLAVLMATLVMWTGALQSAEAHLSDQFFIPVNGHVECLRSVQVKVKEIELETVDDVISFYKRCQQIPISQQELTSWGFLSSIDLERIELPAPKPPRLPEGQVLISRSISGEPKWLATTLDYDHSRHAVSVEFDGYQRRDIATDRFRMIVSDANDERQVTFADQPPAHAKQLDSADLFSRSNRWLDHDATQQDMAGFTLFSVDHERVTQYFLTETDKDSICARFTISRARDRVNLITFHLGLVEYSDPKPHTLPSLTLVFRRSSSPGTWKLNCYFITNAVLDEPLPASAFTASLEPGDLFVAVNSQNGTQEPRRIRYQHEDIAAVTPQEIMDRESGDAPDRNRNQGSIWGGTMLIAVNVIVLLAIAAGVVVQRVFSSKRAG